ncbi:MAG: AAA family ATPase, partial [Firmicutes bacterium]|nr:AAA family ATPase [Bacillota bacterium]
MKFKQIEVFGFKSFADKTDILFGDGITAIVGPNGCGKSNVADAIRWVLGEQSPRYLRAGKMADVIFNGTEKRKSMSYCEVLLRFDNRPHTDGSKMFPSLEFNEVTVSRKLYRSGESLYLINGKECRLKDVTLLLREGNMGRSGYSIIGQGRIDELLSAKAENRRPIFEEAAGISGHKEKKKEAESKLVRTRENLSRLNDILFEKQSVLEPLSLQAEKARKCLDLRDKLKEHDINIYIHQRDTAEDIKAKIAVSLAGATEELDQK